MRRFEGQLEVARLTNDCHVGGLGHGEEGWGDGDLAEVSSSQLGLHRVQHHSDVVGGRHLNTQPLFSVISTRYNAGCLRVREHPWSLIIHLSGLHSPPDWTGLRVSLACQYSLTRTQTRLCYYKPCQVLSNSVKKNK